MIILNVIDDKLFVQLGTRAFRIISLKMFSNSFYSILGKLTQRTVGNVLFATNWTLPCKI